MLKLTQPVLNEVFPHRARGAISHDLKERGAFTPAEAISQRRCLVLWVGALRCFEPCHAGVGKLLYRDFRCLEEGGCFGPDRFIEWERVAKEAVRATVVGGRHVRLRDMLGDRRIVYLPQTEIMLQYALTTQRV
jgi:hypothetical protein